MFFNTLSFKKKLDCISRNEILNQQEVRQTKKSFVSCFFCFLGCFVKTFLYSVNLCVLATLGLPYLVMSKHHFRNVLNFHNLFIFFYFLHTFKENLRELCCLSISTRDWNLIGNLTWDWWYVLAHLNLCNFPKVNGVNKPTEKKTGGLFCRKWTKTIRCIKCVKQGTLKSQIKTVTHDLTLKSQVPEAFSERGV